MVGERHRLRRRRVRLHRHHGALRPRRGPAGGVRPRAEDEATSPEPVVERLTGRDLLGRSYTPPFSYYLGHEQAFRVVEADFVTTEDGTGLVHTAGAFGEEDKVVTDREGIEPVVPVAKDGKFTFPVTDYEGLQVFDANLRSSTTSRRRPRARASRARSRPAPCCCAASPTTTPTRTAGAAASR